MLLIPRNLRNLLEADDKGGSSSDKGGDNSGSSGSIGSEKGANDNPISEEPSAPPPQPMIVEPPPIVEQPPPPPPTGTCEQGSTPPECSNVPEPPPPPPIDCSTSPNDPSCKTTPGPIDCSKNPNDPSCVSQPPIDCKTNPDDPSCTTPPICKENQVPDKDKCVISIPIDLPPCKPGQTPDKDKCMHVPIPPGPIDCTKNPDDPSCNVCQPAAIGISCPPQECPKGQHFDDNQNQCVPDPTCSPGQHYDPNQKKCIQDNCPNDQQFDPKLNKCVPNPSCEKDERYDAIQNKCIPICPDGTELLNGKCPPSKTLSLSISFSKDPIVRGNKETITVKVSDKNLHQMISGANVQGNVRYASGSFDNGGKFSGSTDNSGVISHTWPISGNAVPGSIPHNFCHGYVCTYEVN